MGKATAHELKVVRRAMWGTLIIAALSITTLILKVWR